jgi:hypothetical protein
VASPSARLNGTSNGHASQDGAEPPVKRLKGADGVVVVTPGDQATNGNTNGLETVDDVADEEEDDYDSEAEAEAERRALEAEEELLANTPSEHESDEEGDDVDEVLGNVEDEALDDGNDSD